MIDICFAHEHFFCLFLFILLLLLPLTSLHCSSSMVYNGRGNLKPIAWPQPAELERESVLGGLIRGCIGSGSLNQMLYLSLPVPSAFCGSLLILNLLDKVNHQVNWTITSPLNVYWPQGIENFVSNLQAIVGIKVSPKCQPR